MPGEQVACCRHSLLQICSRAEKVDCHQQTAGGQFYLGRSLVVGGGSPDSPVASRNTGSPSILSGPCLSFVWLVMPSDSERYGFAVYLVGIEASTEHPVSSDSIFPPYRQWN